MTTRNCVRAAILVAIVFALPAASTAGIPFPPNCVCVPTIMQFPTRTQCIANFEPDVLRLCPDVGMAPPFDRMRLDLTIADALGTLLDNVTVKFVEAAGSVNVAVGGSTTALTGPPGGNPPGMASIILTNASGNGVVNVCADGVFICRFEIRTPDVGRAPSGPGSCTLPTTVATFVNGADLINPVCGFLAQFGPVVPGVNNGWDLTCDNNVNGADVIGILGKGGVIQHFGHTELLAGIDTCP